MELHLGCEDVGPSDLVQPQMSSQLDWQGKMGDSLSQKAFSESLSHDHRLRTGEGFLKGKWGP